MKAKKFDADFDNGKDIMSALDLSTARRPNLIQKRASVALPAWMLASLNKEAGRLGVTRQSIIKMWLGERLGEPLGERLGRVDSDAYNTGKTVW